MRIILWLLASLFAASFATVATARKLTGKKSMTRLAESPPCQVTCITMAFHAPISR